MNGIIDLYLIHDRYHTVAVIPAKAGIQTINELPHVVGQHLDYGFVRYAEIVRQAGFPLSRE